MLIVNTRGNYGIYEKTPESDSSNNSNNIHCLDGWWYNGTVSFFEIRIHCEPEKTD